MELRVANNISSFLVLGFKVFLMDIDDFFSSVHYFFHDFPKFLSKKWDIFWGKMQKPIAQEPLRSIIENSCDEKRIISFPEINSMLNRVGIVGLDDCENKSNLYEDDLLGLFDVDEPGFDEIKETFKAFDTNDDGFIDAGELQRVVLSLGVKEGCSLNECKVMIKSFDVDGDGLIDFKEFVVLMERCLC